MGKKGGAKQRVTAYRMSFHFGICHGPVDVLRKVFIGEREASEPMSEDSEIHRINKIDLFGGEKDEGGTFGLAHYFSGTNVETLSTFLATKLGKTPTTAPGYRGIASLWLTEEPVNDITDGSADDAITGVVSSSVQKMLAKSGGNKAGFLMGNNNPYLKGVWTKVTRIPKGFYTSKGEISETPSGELDVDPEVRSQWTGDVASSPLLFGEDGKTYALYRNDNASIRLMNVDTGDVEITEALSDIHDEVEAVLEPLTQDWESGIPNVVRAIIIPGTQYLLLILASASGVQSDHGFVYYKINSSSEFEYCGGYAGRVDGLGVQYTQTGQGIYTIIANGNLPYNAGVGLGYFAQKYPIVFTYIDNDREVIFAIPSVNDIIANGPYREDISNAWFVKEMHFLTSGADIGNLSGFFLPFQNSAKFFLWDDRQANADTQISSVRIENTLDESVFGWSPSLGTTVSNENANFDEFPFEDIGLNYDGSSGDDDENYFGVPSVFPVDENEPAGLWVVLWPRYFLNTADLGKFGIVAMLWDSISGTASLLDYEKAACFTSESIGTVLSADAKINWDSQTGLVTVSLCIFTNTTSAKVVFDFGTLTLDGFGAAEDLEDPEANPAHIIYECLTNPDWGMGASRAAINIPSFRSAADTLYTEHFGLSLMWTKASSIESFVQEILNHIEGVLFLDPASGLLTLRLVRDDYNPDTAPVLDGTNCVVTKFQRRDIAETINEIQVTWTNPVNEQEETITVQDLGNISLQGALVSDGRNYYGIRRASLAQTVAFRDLRVASTPLAAVEIEANREAWDQTPASVFKLNHPEVEEQGLIFRVGNIDYGKPGDSKIKISAVEDVFAYGTSEQVVIAVPQWQDPSQIPVATTPTAVFTLPFFLTSSMLAPAVAAGIEYPEVFAGILGATTQTDASGFDLLVETTDIVGEADVENVGTRSHSSRGTLQEALTQEASSTIASLGPLTVGVGSAVGHLILINPGDEDDCEFAIITEYNESEETWSVARGILDTTPKAWPLGTAFWLIRADSNISDDSTRSAAEEVTYQLLTRTSAGVLSEDDAEDVLATLTERPHLPLRPAKVSVNGTLFGSSNCDELSEIPISWARRNRLTEEVTVLRWGDDDTTPEEDQTTTIYVFDIDGNEIETHSALSGTSYNLTVSSEMSGYTKVVIQVKSERDDLESLQGHEITAVLSSGYGLSYGENYGGA